MTQQISKADRIRKLLHLSNAVIAERVGCPEVYVRVVRQRTTSTGKTMSRPCDYGSRTHELYKRRQHDLEFRKLCLRNLERSNSYMRRAEARAS